MTVTKVSISPEPQEIDVVAQSPRIACLSGMVGTPIAAVATMLDRSLALIGDLFCMAIGLLATVLSLGQSEKSLEMLVISSASFLKHGAELILTPLAAAVAEVALAVGLVGTILAAPFADRQLLIQSKNP